FAGEDARLVAVGDSLVLAEQIADLALAHSDVAGRDVGVLAQVAVQLGHQRLTEAHDLAVAAALGVEVRSPFGAPDRHAGDGGLGRLLGGEELDHAQVDGRAETDAALVGAESGVELDAEGPVDLPLAVVVRPRHPEDDLALWLTYTL